MRHHVDTGLQADAMGCGGIAMQQHGEAACVGGHHHVAQDFQRGQVKRRTFGARPPQGLFVVELDATRATRCDPRDGGLGRVRRGVHAFGQCLFAVWVVKQIRIGRHELADRLEIGGEEVIEHGQSAAVFTARVQRGVIEDLVNGRVAVVLDQGRVTEVQETARLLPLELGVEPIEVAGVAAFQACGVVKVHVAVDQAGNQESATAFNDPGSGRVQRRRGDFDDAIIADTHMSAAQGSLTFRRDDSHIADQQVFDHADAGTEQEQSREQAGYRGGHG